MDAAEFDEFYAGSVHRLVGQLTAMTGDRSVAQDCVQEAFVRAWQHRRQLDSYRAPEAWVRVTASRVWLSGLRRAKTAERAQRKLSVVPSIAPPNADRVDLETALAELGPDQRRAVVLYYLCDLSVEQIAAETDVAVGTVKTRLHRARAALAELLADDVGEGEAS